MLYMLLAILIFILVSKIGRIGLFVLTGLILQFAMVLIGSFWGILLILVFVNFLMKGLI